MRKERKKFKNRIYRGQIEYKGEVKENKDYRENKGKVEFFSSNHRYSHCSSSPLLLVAVQASVSIGLSFQE